MRMHLIAGIGLLVTHRSKGQPAHRTRSTLTATTAITVASTACTGFVTDRLAALTDEVGPHRDLDPAHHQALASCSLKK